MNTTNMDAVETVLAKMKELGKPVNATLLATETGLDKIEVDKAMKALKEQGRIVSPKRCYWAPAE